MAGNNRKEDIREHPEKSLVLSIDLSRGLAVALLIVAVIVVTSMLVRGPAPASAAGEAVSAATDNMRRYYLGAVVYANTAITGCAPGYHFASMWEIVDPSNLVYDTVLGVLDADSGEGPPTTWFGWVRTGYSADYGTTVGHANCDAWTSIASQEYGTTARLTSSWLAGGELHVWDVGIGDCQYPAHIWCVED